MLVVLDCDNSWTDQWALKLNGFQFGAVDIKGSQVCNVINRKDGEIE